MNWRAVAWAYAQEDLGMAAKAVLISYAMHADAKGYSWPGVDHIAFTWRLHRGTVRRGIGVLISLGRLFTTKQRRGATGQVKVFRLPKITYESGGKRTRFKNDGSGHKADTKRCISGAPRTPFSIRARADNDRTKNKSDHDSRVRARGTLNAPAVASSPRSDFVFEGYQNQPAQSHVKFPEFAAWCRSKRGTPSEEGFWSWLGKQKPQWRNRVRQKQGGEEGYELDGKFYTKEEANQLAANDPKLTVKFRPVAMRNGKIIPR